MSSTERAERVVEVTVTMTVDQAKHIASVAARSNHWDVLKLMEEALRDTGLEPPMDVYCEVADLRKKLRDLGGKP